MTLLVSTSWNSLAGWDFYIAVSWDDLPEANRSLDTTYYVSPPTSLSLSNDGSLWSISVALSNHAATQDLKTGTIITWASRGAPPGGTSGSTAVVFIGVDLLGSGISINLFALSAGTFSRHRIEWWQDGGNTKWRGSSWDGSSWAVGGIQTATGMTGDVNRCGVVASAAAGSRWCLFDNTEIYDTVDEEGLGQGISYPTDEITRVTGITKIHDRSRRPTIYRLAAQLGGLANLASLEDAFDNIVKDPTTRDRYFREPWLDPREKTLPKMEPRVDLPKPMPLKPGLPVPEPKPLPSPAPPKPRAPSGRGKPGIARGRGGTIIKGGGGFPSGGSGGTLRRGGF